MLEQAKFDVTSEIDFPNEKFVNKGRIVLSVKPVLNIARYGTL